jgi:glycosyltransferase involved in cell wall biosynthesis
LRILICTGWTPFIEGGTELLADSLRRELEKAGHQAAVYRVPFVTDPKDEIIKSYLACRLLDLSRTVPRIDRIIALKFPAFVLPHPQKVVWLIQQYRQVYDLRGTEHSIFGASPQDQDLRRAIYQMDRKGIGEAQRVLAISQNVAGRLKRYNGLDATVAYPPPPQDGSYYLGGYGDYILSVGRLDPLKRVDRLVRAMGHVRSGVRCKIVGTGPEMQHLEQLAEKAKARDRIEFLGRVDDAALIELYAGALAVFYGPYDEDYGLVTVEAMKSSKPVLTFEDSGGVVEFVRQGETGYIIPTQDAAEALAELCDRLFLDRKQAEALGARALERVAQIGWPTVLPQLLEG